MKTRRRLLALPAPLLLAGLAALAVPAGDATAQQGPANREANLDRGRAVYTSWCATCHAPGRGQPGTASLAVKYGNTRPAVLAERDDLTPDAIKLFVRRGVLSMPPFRKTEITDAELDDLAAYLSSAANRR